MMKSFLSALIVFSVMMTANQLAFSQTSSTTVSKKDMERIARIKKDVSDIGVGSTITVSRLDNRDFFGKVTKVGFDDFEILETDTKISHIFKYVDLKNVRDGDGERNLLTGRRKNPRRSWLWGGLVVAGFMTVVIIGLREK